MATITDGVTTISPLVVVDYATEQASRNIVHDILGRPDPDYSLAPASLRSGTLNLVFESNADADQARSMHAGDSVFEYAEPDQPTAAMRYVVQAGGRINLSIDKETLTIWTLSVPYQEVL